MISRKKFIKISGLSALAIGSGFSLGKLLPETSAQRFAIYGFLPTSDEIIKSVISSFIKRGYGKTTPSIIANEYQTLLISSVHKLHSGLSLFESGSVIYKIASLQKPTKSDILVSDSKTTVYAPLNDFDTELLNLRAKMRDIEASIFFSVEYISSDVFSSLINLKNKMVVLENEEELLDKIPLNSSYNEIALNGPAGKTLIEIKDNHVRVKRSSCRNRICEKAGTASMPGDVIACAPNKLLIRIEEA